MSLQLLMRIEHINESLFDEFVELDVELHCRTQLGNVFRTRRSLQRILVLVFPGKVG